MKIVFVIPTQSGGGAEKVVNLIATSLPTISKSCEVKIITLLAEDIITSGEPFSQVVNLNSSRVINALPALYGFLRTERPDVVVSTLKHVSIICNLVCFLLNLRHITRVANNYTMELQGMGVVKRTLYYGILKFSSALSKEFICVSMGVENDLTENFGVKKCKSRVIYNPVDSQITESLNNDDRKHEIEKPRGSKVFLFVGRLTKQKNLPFLFECMKAADTSNVLWIVGSGPEELALKSLVNKYCLNDRVFFYGHMHNTASFYRNADCFVMTSNYEGFPNVLLEALSYGLPLISVDCLSGPSEIITTEDIGYLIPRNDIAGFVEAMGKIDKSCGFVSRKTIVNERYNINKIAREYYNAICN